MLKMGIYIDHENIRLSGGQDLDYQVLLKYLSQEHYLIRASVYAIVDYEQPADLQEKLHRYRDKLRHIGYKVLEKERTRFIDPDTGVVNVKSNVDMELAIDVLRELENIDVVVIVSGDGDFARLAEAAQTRGRRVWVVAFENISKKLREVADVFIDGSRIEGIRRQRNNDQGYKGASREVFSLNRYGS